MKKIFVLLLSLLMVFSFTACGNGGGGEQKVDEGDTVVVYTSSAQEVLDVLEPAFEKATGLDVEFISMASAEGYARLVAEKDDPQADVYQCGGLAEILTDTSLFQEYVSPHNSELPAIYQNNYGYCATNSGSTHVIFYNTDLCPIEIKSYADLLDPRLKGHIAIADPLKSNSAYYHIETMLVDMGKDPANCSIDDQGWDYVTKFLEQLDGKFVNSSSVTYKGVESGEYWVGCSWDTGVMSYLADLKEAGKGDNVKVVLPAEGVITKLGGPGLIANCKHPNNGKAYLDYVTSKEWAEIAVTIPGQVVLMDVPGNTYYDVLGFTDQTKTWDCSSYWTSQNKAAIVDKLQTIIEQIGVKALPKE
ncbi:MAG: extracellular solute-binding protein [Erysipelotrichaceae bacterium]|nr:extracellular solute-binding protein [Erysipelotrichaceae bacterium]